MLIKRISVAKVLSTILIPVLIHFLTMSSYCNGKELNSKINSTENSGNDSLYLKMYLSDRDYFLKLQETVSSKNQYIGLQWCIDLLNKYIQLEEKNLKETEK